MLVEKDQKIKQISLKTKMSLTLTLKKILKETWKISMKKHNKVEIQMMMKVRKVVILEL